MPLLQRILDALTDDFGFLIPGSRRRLTGERLLRILIYLGLLLYLLRLVLLAVEPEWGEKPLFFPGSAPFELPGEGSRKTLESEQI